MAGKNGDGLRSVADNPTGAGDIPVVSTAQVEALAQPGGTQHKAAPTPESSDMIARPGGSEGGARSAGTPIPFARPGGQEGW